MMLKHRDPARRDALKSLRLTLGSDAPASRDPRQSLDPRQRWCTLSRVHLRILIPLWGPPHMWRAAERQPHERLRGSCTGHTVPGILSCVRITMPISWYVRSASCLLMSSRVQQGSQKPRSTRSRVSRHEVVASSYSLERGPHPTRYPTQTCAGSSHEPAKLVMGGGRKSSAATHSCRHRQCYLYFPFGGGARYS